MESFPILFDTANSIYFLLKTFPPIKHLKNAEKKWSSKGGKKKNHSWKKIYDSDFAT